MSEVENEVEAHEEAKEPAKEAPKPSRADYDRLQAEKASQSGWKDFDAYVEEGGDPAKWKTADAFNVYGELIGTVKRKELEFNQRIDGVQKMAQSQLAAQREELLSKRDAAIELGQVKEVHSIEKQINTLNQQQPQQVVPGVAELNEWNANNAWVTEKTPKAAFARELWNDLQSKMPIPQALQVLESEITKHYPTTRQPKAHIPEQETGKGPQGFGTKNRTLTMADLNDDEKLAWRWQGQSAWKGDEKAFLKAATDMRKAAGGK